MTIVSISSLKNKLWLELEFMLEPLIFSKRISSLTMNTSIFYNKIILDKIFLYPITCGPIM